VDSHVRYVFSYLGFGESMIRSIYMSSRILPVSRVVYGDGDVSVIVI
jgi:hypothetical protein